MTLHLTSSDFISSSGPGTPGDWYNMLGPLGLLEWDTTLAAIFYFCGALSLVLAFYSAWYYWGHTEEYLRRDTKQPAQLGGTKPGVPARITQEDYERDPFTGERFNSPWQDPWQK